MTNLFTLIPARSGSKGVSHKNILKFAGKSLIERAIQFSYDIGIETVIVSTDSNQYMALARNAGAQFVPLRPSYLSEDDTSSYDVVAYEWKLLEEAMSHKFDFCLLLEPTSPLRRLDLVSSLMSSVLSSSGKYLSGFTASRVPKSQHPDKYFYINESTGCIHQFNSSCPQLPIANRHECSNNLLIKDGSAYFTSRQEVFVNSRLISFESYVAINESLSINIDTPYDVLLAEAFFAQNQYLQ